MKKAFFITGTDTGVGKTAISVSLLYALKSRGEKAAGFKPVATGCTNTPEGLRNEDALALMELSSVELPYETVNPYAFEPPVAPNIAAKKAGVAIDLDRICAAYDEIAAQTDYVIVEGVGGFLAPLSDTLTMADLAVRLQLPVILVVSIRLGSINHALLTMESIRARGIPVKGWVANILHRKEGTVPEQIDSLRRRLGVPILGIIPPMPKLMPEWMVDYFSIEQLL